jgi:hypothetical protein
VVETKSYQILKYSTIAIINGIRLWAHSQRRELLPSIDTIAGSIKSSQNTKPKKTIRKIRKLHGW